MLRFHRLIVIACAVSFFFCVSNVYAQKSRKISGSDVVMTIDTIRADKTASAAVSVPVNVVNFKNIGAITLKITYDTLQLQYKGVSNISGIKSINYSCRNGVITIGWFDPTGGVAGGNVADGKFFDLNFNLTGNASDIRFITDQCDIADKNVNTLKVIYKNGAVLPGTSSTEKIKKKTADFKLGQNYPNPFNPATRIEYSIPFEAKVTLKVFNLIGREIATIVDKYLPAGDYFENFSGEGLPSGIYIYSLQAGAYSQTRKMILSK